GDVAAVGVRAALVDVLVQEVQAAREAEGLDLFEEVLDLPAYPWERRRYAPRDAEPAPAG
ncbi:hypothetical protein, partial [Streptomyces sp. NPDC059538]|uniref:hypothetical protein n=1 Tax=Streptomyces sp. NPDC059538 TaxID=3346860 RepID=UPI00368CFF6A